jgi:tetratricopeptide (TPR) repeat protein
MEVRWSVPSARVVAVLAAALVRPLAGQLPAAEDAFRLRNYAAARAAYERVLATDSLNVQALYRLAVLDSWEGNLTRSLERFARVRTLAPNDADIMASQAAALGWAGKRRAAEALYDSVLARSPERSDALAGRARVVSWSGDLDRAERLWRGALTIHPDNPELLLGLAQTLYWKGHPALAESYAARARALAPSDRAALELERQVRAALRPEVETAVDGAGDSETNDFIAQEASLTTALSGEQRLTLHAGWRYATLGASRGTSYGAGGSVSAALSPRLGVRAGLGLRRLEPDVGAATTPLTGEFGLTTRLARYAAMSIEYSRIGFDETALLIQRGFVIDAVDLSVDVSPRTGWSISGGGGGARISDGNRRYSATMAALAPLGPGLQVGPFARIMGFRTNPLDGYFAPNRFSVFEARLVYARQRDRWGVRADGGVGAQQVLAGAAVQAEWHVRLTLSRGWGENNELALVGSITNSAAATSTAGVRSEAFRFRALGLRFTQGL